MVVIRILVALIQAILRIAAEALSHFMLLLAGIAATAAAVLAIAGLTSTGALAIFRRTRNKNRKSKP